VKNRCILRRGDKIKLDTSWLCIPCLPSKSWKNRVHQSVNGLNGVEKLAIAHLQGSHPTQMNVSKRACVMEHPENRFRNNAWNVNETLETSRIRQRMALGLHEISFGNHSCDPSVTVSLPCLPDGYTRCACVKFTVIRDPK